MSEALYTASVLNQSTRGATNSCDDRVRVNYFSREERTRIGLAELRHLGLLRVDVGKHEGRDLHLVVQVLEDLAAN